MAASIVAAALAAAGSIGAGVASAAHGGPPSPISDPSAPGAGGFTPTAQSFGSKASGAPPAADLRLSDLVGQQRKRPEDEMTLGMMMGGGMGGGY